MAIHSYNVEIAIEYGIEEAILIQHFAHWIGEHAANGINLQEGRFWSYDKTDALYAILPEFKNKKKIEYFINKLVDKDILIKGNFNKVKFDRTLWYTFTDNGLRLIFEHGILTYECMVKIIDEVSKVSDFDFPFLGNGNTNNWVTITHNNHHNKESTHFVRTEEKTGTSNFDLTFIRQDYADCVLEWLTHKKKIKKGYKTEAGIKKMYNALFEMSHGDSSIAQMIIDQSIANNWDGLFPLKVGAVTMSKTQQQEQESYEKQKRVLEMMAERERRPQNGDYGVTSDIANAF